MSIFDYTYVKKPKRSKFKLSYENKLTCNMGKLVPFMKFDVVPGDTFRVKSEMLLRFAPLMAPVMHRIDVFTHYFFVPYRLVWDEWKDFITGGVDGTVQPSFPRVTPTKQLFGGEGSLADYLGLNINDSLEATSLGDVSLLPFRAYQLIWNEYYRDQTLMDEVYFSKHSSTNTGVPTAQSSMRQLYDSDDDHPQSVTNAITALQQLVTLRSRAWEKDYFTSALPFPQRGLEAVVPVTSGFDPTQLQAYAYNTAQPHDVSWVEPTILDRIVRKDGGALGDDIYVREDGQFSVNGEVAKVSTSNSSLKTNENHQHVISSSGLQQLLNETKFRMSGQETDGGFSIHELRLANSLQKWLEKAAIGGSRYVEQIAAFFGVQVPDFTIQRPQYLGGGRQQVRISEVLQTSETTQNSPQGYMAGHAYAVGNENKFKHTFNEHGIVMGIMSIRPRTGYMQGLDRFYTKFDKFDYYFPQFAHLSEQEIKKKELVWTGVPAIDEATFGYQQRYAEYKYKSDEVHGDFKTSLDFWHLGRKFDVLPPILSSNFVTCDPSDRIFAVDDDGATDKLYCQIYNNVTAIRPMPKDVHPSL